MEATSTDCTWCKSMYQVESSHARDAKTFCSKTCELEARFWLFRLFQPADAAKALPEGRAQDNK